MGKKTKIDTFTATWNPLSGCYNGCDYCYARRIGERFAGYDTNDDSDLNRYSFSIIGYHGFNLYEVDRQMTRKTKEGETQAASYPFGFAPTLYNYKFSELAEWKAPEDIFVCSMADLFGPFIPDDWIKRVFYACEKHPQHRYFFLTKNPLRYVELSDKGIWPKEPSNFWFGTTVTKANEAYFWKSNTNCFLSIEPIHADMELNGSLHDIQWVIVGAETGNRVGKIKPERSWVEHIAETCRMHDIPLFMKDNLQALRGDDFVQEKPGRNE